MSTLKMSSEYERIVIGGGAAGALVALHYLSSCSAAGHEPRIAVVEPRASLAQGAAYSTDREEHRLNVPAGRMSAFADRPHDFVDYLIANPDPALADLHGHDLDHAYAPRRAYGAYLLARLREQPLFAALQHVRDEAVALGRSDDGFVVTLLDGTSLRAAQVVLAIGNAPRALPIDAGELPVVESWDYPQLDRMSPDARITVIGSGLSMVDSVMTRLRAGHRGPITVLSRHGLLPLPHAAEHLPSPLPSAAENLPSTVLGLWRTLRRRALQGIAQGEPWQWTFERLRPYGQQLWQSLSAPEQARFLRHAVRYWDIHRHRIAPEIAAELQAMMQAGQLHVLAGRLLPSTGTDAATLRFRARDGAEQNVPTDVVINATGVETRFERPSSPLLASLLANGLAVPGPHGLGILTDGLGRALDAQGAPLAGLQVLGSSRIGTLWETIAMPELRVQARDCGQIEAAARTGCG